MCTSFHYVRYVEDFFNWFFPLLDQFKAFSLAFSVMSVHSSSLGDLAGCHQWNAGKEHISKQWLCHVFGQDLGDFVIPVYSFLIANTSAQWDVLWSY